jgi:hypothetical protein
MDHQLPHSYLTLIQYLGSCSAFGSITPVASIQSLRIKRSNCATSFIYLGSHYIAKEVHFTLQGMDRPSDLCLMLPPV